MPTTSNFGWTTPADTDLVKDGALAIRTLGNGIDTSFLDLKGGTTGQVLSKASNTDLDFTWIAVDPLTILDAKGDLISATAADTPARLAVGTNGQVLTADSTTSTGLKWATPASGGKVLQVVSGTATTWQGIKTASATDVTGMTVTLTPSATSSKVLITGMLNVIVSQTSSRERLDLRLVDGSNTSLYMIYSQSTNPGTSSYGALNVPFTYLHSPNTTSSITYKLRVTNDTSAQGIYVNNYDTAALTSSIVAMEIGA